MTQNEDSFSLEIPITQADISVIQWLLDYSKHSEHPLSKQRIKDAMNKGAVWIKHKNTVTRIRRGSKVASQGDSLFLYYNPKVLQQKPAAAKLLADHVQYSVWYKPSGMLSHGSKWSDHCSITRWIEQNHLPQRSCFLIHRLDRAASGIMLIAHTKKTAAQLCRLFEERHIEKCYQAIVSGHFPEGSHIVDTPIDGKQALSIIQRLDYHSESNQSLVDVSIKTGRKHQIRRHLAGLGYPITGDRLYNVNGDSNMNIDLQLRSCLLGFTCPISQEPQLFTLPTDQCLSFST